MKQFSAKKSHDALRREKLLRGVRNILSRCVMCSGLCHAQYQMSIALLYIIGRRSSLFLFILTGCCHVDHDSEQWWFNFARGVGEEWWNDDHPFWVPAMAVKCNMLWRLHASPCIVVPRSIIIVPPPPCGNHQGLVVKLQQRQGVLRITQRILVLGWIGQIVYVQALKTSTT